MTFLGKFYSIFGDSILSSDLFNTRELLKILTLVNSWLEFLMISLWIGCLSLEDLALSDLALD